MNNTRSFGLVHISINKTGGFTAKLQNGKSQILEDSLGGRVYTSQETYYRKLDSINPALLASLRLVADDREGHTGEQVYKPVAPIAIPIDFDRFEVFEDDSFCPEGEPIVIKRLVAKK